MPKHAEAASENGPVDGADREITLRALLTGALIGSLLAAGNVYTGLKIAFIDGGAITAAVIGYSIFAVLRPRLPYTRHENNVTQATAAAAAVMGAVAGFAGPIPAMAMLGTEVSVAAIGAWGVGLGVLGMLVAVTLTRQLVYRERLPFPTGTATAEVIRAAFGSGQGARTATLVLLAGLALAMAITGLRDLGGWLPAAWLVPLHLGAIGLSQLGVGVGVSPLLIATGAMMGPRGGLSFALGSGCAWLGLGPLLLDAQIVSSPDFVSLVGWLVWPGVALMVASALTGLALQSGSMAAALRDVVRTARAESSRESMLGRTTFIVATVAAASVVALVGTVVFGVHLGLLLLLLPVSWILAAVCARATGETDVAPVGAVGAVGQIGFGAGGPVASLAAGSVATGMSTHAATLLWSMRVARRLGSTAKAMIVAQGVGTLVGIAVVVPTYAVVASAYGIGTERMPAPGALTWKATAEAVASGTSALPPFAGWAMLSAAALGVALSLAGQGQGRLARFVPSPVAMGIGFVMPAYFGGAILFGVVVLSIARRFAPTWCERHATAAAAGAMAGESLMGVAVAGAMASGLLP